MKKAIAILGISLLMFASCEKEVTGCGEVTGTGRIDCTLSGDCYYYLPVRFDSGVSKEVSVDYNTWINSLPGERICF
jgi:hypothetical protein